MPAYRQHSDRLFYGGMAVVMAATVFAGFSHSYFLKLQFGTPPLNPLLHVHGLAFTTWIVLFFTQTVLIANKRHDIHRKLGIAGAVLAVAMVTLGVSAAIWAIRANHTPAGIDPRSFLVLPFFDIGGFATLVAAGIALRKQSETHKRLMLLGTVALLDAAIARIPGVLAIGIPFAFALQDLFIVACAVYDYTTRGRVHPAYLWGGLVILVSQPLRLFVSQTPLWLAFGDWLKG
jgi:hypothetical protein